MKTPTPNMTQDSTARAREREAARLVGDLLREERRADDRSLASVFAASEREFESLVHEADHERT